MVEDELEADKRATTSRRRSPIQRWLVRGLLCVALILVGVAGGIVWSERRALWSPVGFGVSTPRPGVGIKGGDVTPALPVREEPAGVGPARDDEPVEVALTAEAVERAGIKTSLVRSEAVAGTITVPGTVTTNAYRDTKVNALVGGIVRGVGVELGQRVTRRQTLAGLFSNELAEAQMKYLSMRAMFAADHQKLDRTEQLVTIGAASRQELEEVTATHHGHETELAAARQRLLLLGLT